VKIIKRNGSEEEFDRQKIKNAIAKANISDDGKAELTDRQIDYISLVIEDHCKELGHALSVEEIQELVETHIILQGAPGTGKTFAAKRLALLRPQSAISVTVLPGISSVSRTRRITKSSH
jgi:SpoVK/Ycf46/Vps4 family AAA+-type ATPase